MAAGRLVGTSVRRLEDNRLLLGQGRFVADISVSRPLFMSIVRSKKAHAFIEKIDTTAAQLSPGVRRVVVGSELASSVAPLPSIDMAGEGVAACFRVLSIDKVRYVGEPVAAVFAEDPFQAHEAAELVDIR
jgi:aerobic carbon-monoxide dehydrogenase large subunit